MSLAIIPMITAGVATILGKYTSRKLIYTFSEGAQVTLGGLGVIVHELGHAIFALIFSHHITHITLLSPKFKQTGYLGSVEQTYNPHNLWADFGNFFIGLAPFYFVSSFLWFMQKLLVGNPFPVKSLAISSSLFLKQGFLTQTGQFLKTDLSLTFSQFPSWQFFIYLILVLMCASTGYDLSKADWQGIFHGFVYYAGILVIFFLAVYILNIQVKVIPFLWLVLFVSFLFLIRALVFISLALVVIYLFSLIRIF